MRLIIECDTPEQFTIAQDCFKQFGWDWRGCWSGFNMNFSNGKQWLYVNENGTFDWDIKSPSNCDRNIISLTEFWGNNV